MFTSMHSVYQLLFRVFVLYIPIIRFIKLFHTFVSLRVYMNRVEIIIHLHAQIKILQEKYFVAVAFLKNKHSLIHIYV